MVIEKYGICLESISSSDLELIRQWRNLDHVRLNMQYREIITAEMQIKWYNESEKANNIYFIIKYKNKKAGVINLKDINRDAGTAEAGIFIGDTEQLNSFTPIPATIALMEFAFDELKLNKLMAKVAIDNEKAILYNTALGYKKSNLKSDGIFTYYETNRQAFTESVQKIKNTLNKLTVRDTLHMTEDERVLYKISGTNLLS